MPDSTHASGYKVLAADQTPHHGGTGKWVKNRWRSVNGQIVPVPGRRPRQAPPSARLLESSPGSQRGTRSVDRPYACIPLP